MKRLILTLGLLLVSAALLGTSTFAWFSMNKDVTITGMQVKAITPAYIYISTSNNMSGRSNSVTAPTAVTNISPASTKDLTRWFTGKSDSANVSTIGEAGYVAKTESDTLYINQTYYVQSPNNAVKNLKVNTIAVTYTGDTASAVNTALRVAVKCGNTTLFFAPCSEATTTTAVTKAGGADEGQTETLNLVARTSNASSNKTTTATYNSQSSIILAELAADVIQQVEVFVYFDGEDSACTSINALNLNQLSVTISFQIDDASN